MRQSKTVAKIWQALKNRGVPAVAATYLITSWLILEVGHILSVILDMPHMAMRIVFWLLVLLFPAALVLAWVYRPTGGASFDLPETEPAARSEHALHEQAEQGQPAKSAHAHVVGGLDPLPFIVGGLALVFVVTLAISKLFGSGNDKLAPSNAPARETVRAAPKNSIAVLAFANLSGDKSQDYFADGMAEEVLDALSKISQLQVAARTSSFSFKGSTADIKTIGAKLGVAYVLDGSVRLNANTMRINAALIDTRTGFKTWAEVYDRKLDDVFKVQKSVALAVIGALQTVIKFDAPQTSADSETSNRKAYDDFLEGRHLINLYGGEATKRDALAHFNAAIGADPNYALAYSAKANVLNNLANIFASDTDRRKIYDDALISARRAVSLAPDSAVANSVLAITLVNARFGTAAAAPFYEKSMKYGNGKASILLNYGTAMCRQGKVAMGLSVLQKAVVLDPLNPRAFYVMGTGQYAARHYADSIAAFRHALQLNPAMANAHAGIGDSLLMQNNLAAARAEYSLEPVYWAKTTGLAVVAARSGNKAEALALLNQLKAKNGDASAYQYAQIIAQLGDDNAALDALDHAYVARDAGLLLLKTDPLIDKLRTYPRFKTLEDRMDQG